MTTLKVGIARYEEMQARTMRIARGERHVFPREIEGLWPVLGSSLIVKALTPRSVQVATTVSKRTQSFTECTQSFTE